MAHLEVAKAALFPSAPKAFHLGLEWMIVVVLLVDLGLQFEPELASADSEPGLPILYSISGQLQ